MNPLWLVSAYDRMRSHSQDGNAGIAERDAVAFSREGAD